MNVLRSPWLWIGLALGLSCCGIPVGYVGGWFLFLGIFTVLTGPLTLREEEQVGLVGGIICMVIGFVFPLAATIIYLLVRILNRPRNVAFVPRERPG